MTPIYVLAVCVGIAVALFTYTMMVHQNNIRKIVIVVTQSLERYDAIVLYAESNCFANGILPGDGVKHIPIDDQLLGDKYSITSLVNALCNSGLSASYDNRGPFMEHITITK